MTPTPPPTPVLRTRRLLLEPYVPADEDDFVALFLDERVSRWMGDGRWPESRCREVFARIFTHVYANGAFDVWAVRDGDGLLVGHAEIKPSKAADGHELVYALASAVRGRGLGTELADAVVAYGFTALDLPEVHATVAAPNTASLTVLGRLGFRHVGDRPGENGGPVTRLLTCPRERSRTGGDARTGDAVRPPTPGRDPWG